MDDYDHGEGVTWKTVKVIGGWKLYLTFQCISARATLVACSDYS